MFEVDPNSFNQPKNTLIPHLLHTLCVAMWGLHHNQSLGLMVCFSSASISLNYDVPALFSALYFL
jgi:hypothetical protein